ncbi:PQQ-dependent sugar dehydrogenase [Moheibacter lacus]|uniref:PQQ-dependent sugar dehydrogenase n=1 Tax=Moheibacter lacus TaxID=2745851 RepID=A0A838ZUE8_9FLAO|nr:PQQ-dependent sugar dehydrogenase [Moheibacter lacus]MBA5630625.1 PQQ-dependent sugar dehydrogenase [Moheibacter lacus]
MLISCSQKNTSSTASNSSNSTENLAPVETEKPNSDYKSAFKGQTRVAGVKTTTPYQVDVLAESLTKPWAVIPLPDSRLLITEKAGKMQIYDATGLRVKTIEGFPEVDDRGQGGLLDVALDPDFQTNQMIYWSFSEEQADGKNLMAVAKGKLNENSGKVENPTIIFRAVPAMDSSLHYGSRLQFDKDGNLFVSTGERSIIEGRVQAQDLKSALGKIFKITKDGDPAPGNPFVGKEGVIPQIYAYGIRNAQGLAIHPETDDLWETEFGPRGGDELNRIEKGKDYGWPTITYGIEYGGEEIGNPPIQQKEGMEQPIYYWDPVISPSGIVFYEGNQILEWKNNLFIGCLSGQHINRVVLENNKVVGEERLLEDENQRFRDIAYFDGMLYAVTDQGRLYRIKRK